MDSGLTLSTIVEGTPAEFSEELEYPFSVHDFEVAISTLEDLGDPQPVETAPA